MVPKSVSVWPRGGAAVASGVVGDGEGAEVAESVEAPGVLTAVGDAVPDAVAPVVGADDGAVEVPHPASRTAAGRMTGTSRRASEDMAGV
jgi:hypothetical protein